MDIIKIRTYLGYGFMIMGLILILNNLFEYGIYESGENIDLLVMGLLLCIVGELQFLRIKEFEEVKG